MLENYLKKEKGEWIYEQAGLEFPNEKMDFDLYENPRGQLSIQGKVSLLIIVLLSSLGVNKSGSYSVLQDVTTLDEGSVEGRTPVPERQNRTHFYSHPSSLIQLSHKPPHFH